MSRNTALLLVCAVLLIVAGLVGRDGAVARVASSDRGALAQAMDESARPLTHSNSWAADGGSGAAEPVQPTVVDDFDAESMADDDDDSGIGTAAFERGDMSAQSTSAPGEGDHTPFDPRID
ncbi:MAG: hypothetical protein ACK4GD_02120 [Sphingomonadaceae bacterium]